jgi:cytochrome c peroxidase
LFLEMKLTFPIRLLLSACLLALAGASQAGEPVGDGATWELGLPRGMATRHPAALIELGRKLFMDRRLSRNNTMSCGMCHVPEQGFTVNEVATAVGIEGRSLRRNAPTVLNVGFNASLFHDGRASTLEEQAWGPLLAGDEMGNPDREGVVARVAGLADYVEPFENAFPGQAPSAQSIAAALAAYQRSLVAGGSRFDRWYFGGEVDALTSEEKHGFVVFRGKAQCNACHKLGRQHALFTDEEFHNLGVGLPGPGQKRPDVDVALAPGVSAKLALDTLNELFAPPQPDLGRFEVSRSEQDRFAYRTPTLRNVELTAPYMHDGSQATLRDVVDFYDRGGNQNPGLDPLMAPLYLSERDKNALVAFMRTLTAPNVNQLAAEARAAASTASFNPAPGAAVK